MDSDAEMLEWLLRHTTLLLALSASQPTVKVLVTLRQEDTASLVSERAFVFTAGLGSLTRMQGLSVEMSFETVGAFRSFGDGWADCIARAQWENPEGYGKYVVRVGEEGKDVKSVSEEWC
jgi:hypothetical protein